MRVMNQNLLRLVLFGLAILATAASSAVAQDTVRVTAQLNTGIAKLGESVAIVVTVEGSLDGSIGELPDTTGLVIGPSSGPRSERQMHSVNGRMTVERRVTWTIPVRAAVEGEYVIPPFFVTAGGDRYETQPMHLRVLEDLAGAELGLMKLEVSPSKIVVGQPFDVLLTFGWDQAISGTINHADLSLPWWDQLPGAIEIEGGGKRDLGKRYTRVLLNSSAELEVENMGLTSERGRQFQTYSLRRSYLATSPGSIQLPKSHLEFGELRGGGFFENSRAKSMYYVSAEPTLLSVGTVPDEGRPTEFLDAVGSISVRADVDRREINAGDSIKLRVEWTGDGNLEFFTLPDLTHREGLENINFYGATDEIKERHRRVSVFDLAPLSEDVVELPEIALVVYNPELGEYERIATQPISIRVHALEGEGVLEVEGEDGPGSDIRDIRSGPFAAQDLGDEDSPRRDSDPNYATTSAGTLGIILLGWFGLRTQVRRAGDPDAPLERRRRRARREFARALKGADSPVQRMEALGAFLGARSLEGDQAWIGRTWSPTLGGEHSKQLGELGAVLQQLDGAAWGPGAAAGPGDSELLALVESLESVNLESAAEELREGTR
jgi:hypothetical protein